MLISQTGEGLPGSNSDLGGVAVGWHRHSGQISWALEATFSHTFKALGSRLPSAFFTSFGIYNRIRFNHIFSEYLRRL